MAEFVALVAAAEAAGKQAAEAAKPVPMVVYEAQALSNVPKEGGQSWYCAEGMCGFAWIEFAGNTSFGKWMKKAGKARTQYPKGMCVWVSEYGQSVERKEAYAAAYAKVLNEAGVNAYPNSRLD